MLHTYRISFLQHTARRFEKILLINRNNGAEKISVNCSPNQCSDIEPYSQQPSLFRNFLGQEYTS